jgi:hypothetical protein
MTRAESRRTCEADAPAAQQGEPTTQDDGGDDKMIGGLRTELLRADLREQGFVLLRSVFEPALLDELRAALARARREEERRFGLAALEEIGRVGCVSDLLAIGSPLEALLDAKVLSEVLTALLGEEVGLYEGRGIVIDPGKGLDGSPHRWHADLPHVREAIPDETFCFGVSCLVFVDDVDFENGATVVLPGSHGVKRSRTDSEADSPRVELCVAAPRGSLLLLDASTWHRDGQNRSPEPRRVVKLVFTLPWIRPQLDYAALASHEASARLGERARRLLRIPPAAAGAALAR